MIQREVRLRMLSVKFSAFWSSEPMFAGPHPRGGSSKLMERGSDRVKGASGVFRMRERGAREPGALPPVGSRGKAPVGGLEKLKLFCY